MQWRALTFVCFFYFHTLLVLLLVILVFQPLINPRAKGGITSKGQVTGTVRFKGGLAEMPERGSSSLAGVTLLP